MNAPVPSWNTIRSIGVHAPTRGQDTSRERGSQMAPRLGHQCHSRKSYESEIAILDLNTVDKQTSNNCKDEHADANGYADEQRLLELVRQSFLETPPGGVALASKTAELSSSTYVAWVHARTAKDLNLFAPARSSRLLHNERPDSKEGS